MIDHRQGIAIAVIAETELPLVVDGHEVVGLDRLAARAERMCRRRAALARLHQEAPRSAQVRWRHATCRSPLGSVNVIGGKWRAARTSARGPWDFEYDFDHDELAAHRITFEEAVQVFENDYRVLRNKGYRDRRQILGVTDGGRRLKLIVQIKPGNVVRIITGWDR